MRDGGFSDQPHDEQGTPSTSTEGIIVSEMARLRQASRRAALLSALGVVVVVVSLVNAARQLGNLESEQTQLRQDIITTRVIVAEARCPLPAVPLESSDPALEISDLFLKLAPHYADARLVAAKFQTIPPNRRTHLQQLFIEVVLDKENEKDWVETVHSRARAFVDGFCR